MLLMFPQTFIRTTTLRHSRVIKHFVVAAILYTIFVVVDITFTTTYLISNLSASSFKPQMFVFFCFYPLAGCISPILGLLSVRKKRNDNINYSIR